MYARTDTYIGTINRPQEEVYMISNSTVCSNVCMTGCEESSSEAALGRLPYCGQRTVCELQVEVALP